MKEIKKRKKEKHQFDIKNNEHHEKFLFVFSMFVSEVLNKLLHKRLNDNPKVNGEKYTPEEAKLIFKTIVDQHKDFLEFSFQTVLNRILDVPEEEAEALHIDWDHLEICTPKEFMDKM